MTATAPRGTRPALALFCSVALMLSGCSVFGGKGATSTASTSGGQGASPVEGGAEPVLDPAATRAALKDLGSHSGKDLKTKRLAEGLVPPTNRWFSGLVFGDQPQPVFPLPLTFGLDAQGFGFGLPEVTTSEKTIMGGYRPSVKVTVPGASDWVVSTYDELSVTASPRQGGPSVTIAQGSPFVWFTAKDATSLTTNASFTKKGDRWETTDASGTYGLVVDRGSVEGSSITLQAGGRATWFAVPKGGKADQLAKLASPLGGTSASYQVGDQDVTTTLHYNPSKGETAVGALPHQQRGLKSSCTLGTFATIMGEMRLCQGKDLVFTTPNQKAQGTLDVSGLSDAEKEELRKQVTIDVAGLKAPAADTYFGGKSIYRDAQLYAIAKQVNAPEAEQLKSKLLATMDRWTNPKGCQEASEFCFSYDSKNKGIVGKVASFGADEFNDHHFHYGYFLYTAGVLAADDPTLVEKYKPVINLLAADIASSTPSKEFPVRRNFDSYNGHSWASGTSPFADGNNQESSSEGVQAWAGLRLWARASKNTALETQAAWMQSLESATALDYYIDFDLKQPVYQGYKHLVSPLIFGGKRDYATWFSPEPAAMLGIQILPLSPSLNYLGRDPERVGKNIEEGIGTKGFDQKYGDWLLLYSAFQGEEQRQQALEKARNFPAALIDDGLTRSYMLAWLMTLKK